MIKTNSFIVKVVFERKRGLGMKPVKIRQRAAIPTLFADAVTGSTPP